MSKTPTSVVVPADAADAPNVETKASKSLPFSIRTVKRDLRILEDTQYQFAVRINSGAQRIKAIDLVDFAPPPEVLAVWNNTKSKKKPPQIEVFEELGDVIDALEERRRQLYNTYRVDLKTYQSVPGSQLAACLDWYETNLKAYSLVQLEWLLERHKEARNRFLFDEIKPLLNAGLFSDEITHRRLAVYAARFPSLERIQKRFGVERIGPFKIQTLKDELADDVEAQALYAQRAKAELEATQTRTERERLEAAHELELAQLSAAEREVRAKAWAVEAAERLRVETEQEAQRQERLAYAESLRYQQQQFRSAVEEKVQELQQQVLQLLQHNLQKIVAKDYAPANLPQGLRQRLQEITESAALLAETDESLQQVVAQLQNVQTTAKSTQQPHSNGLREQVNALLEQINQQLTPTEWVDDCSTDDEAFADDRAQWVQWS